MIGFSKQSPAYGCRARRRVPGQIGRKMHMIRKGKERQARRDIILCIFKGGFRIKEKQRRFIDAAR